MSVDVNTQYGLDEIRRSEDQSAELQRIVEKHQGEEIVIPPGPPGLYHISGVELPPDTYLRGHATMIHSNRDKKEFNECFIIQDQGLVTIDGFSFDGRLTEQEWEGGNQSDPSEKYWHLEHRCAIRMRSQGHNGVVGASISNCRFMNFTGDGIYCQSYSNLMLRDCFAIDCHRGAVTIGGRTTANINGLHCSGTRDFPTGIYFETHGKHPIDVQMSNVTVEGRFKVECTPGSRIQIDNLKLLVGRHNPTTQHFMITGSGHMQVSNSYFESPHCRIHGAGNLTFTGCHFVNTGQANRKVPGGRTGISYRWKNESGDRRDQLLKFQGCVFRSGESPLGYAAFYSFLKNVPDRNCRLAVSDCDVSGYHYGFVSDRGCNLEVHNSRIEASVAFALKWKSSRGRFLKLNVKQSDFICDQYLWIKGDHTSNRFHHDGVWIPESALSRRLFDPEARVTGGLDIVCTNSPIGRDVPLQPGDRLHHNGRIWRCERGDFTSEPVDRFLT